MQELVRSSQRCCRLKAGTIMERILTTVYLVHINNALIWYEQLVLMILTGPFSI